MSFHLWSSAVRHYHQGTYFKVGHLYLKLLTAFRFQPLAPRSSIALPSIFCWAVKDLFQIMWFPKIIIISHIMVRIISCALSLIGTSVKAIILRALSFPGLRHFLTYSGPKWKLFFFSLWAVTGAEMIDFHSSPILPSLKPLWHGLTRCKMQEILGAYVGNFRGGEGARSSCFVILNIYWKCWAEHRDGREKNKTKEKVSRASFLFSWSLCSHIPSRCDLISSWKPPLAAFTFSKGSSEKYVSNQGWHQKNKWGDGSEKLSLKPFNNKAAFQWAGSCLRWSGRLSAEVSFGN